MDMFTFTCLSDVGWLLIYNRILHHSLFSANREELNNNGEIRKSKSLPEPEATKDLVHTFMRGRGSASGASGEVKNNDEIPMMRSKDTVNQYLKTNSRLTSIEEQAEGGNLTIFTFKQFRPFLPTM